ncbi:3-carboxyethylcatechol 2,3-dioxygenase [Rhodococcus sp. NPDC055024]
MALVCLSHSPMLEDGVLPDEVTAELHEEIAAAREFAADYDPDLVVSFAPDHYNGFFYDLMPQFCIGYAASGVGDFGSSTDSFPVEADTAAELTEHVLDSGVETAFSLKMQVDHAAAQPLELLFGSVAAKPVIPVFVNAVAPPLAPIRRVRQFGEAVGSYLSTLDRKVLVIGSGGLSHDPPVPRIETATERQRAMLLAGRNPTREARIERETRVRAAAAAFARGDAPEMHKLSPEWDREFIGVCERGDVSAFDRYATADISRQAGGSAQEVRTWIAAYSALSAAGAYQVQHSYYRAIPELIAGFGLTIARSS